MMRGWDCYYKHCVDMHYKSSMWAPTHQLQLNGWKRVAVSLLEVPESNLKRLDVSCNRNIGNDGSLFANALKSNSTLKMLYLEGCGVTDEGWASFSNLLCDTSSVNSTYFSNHTLKSISGMPSANAISSECEVLLLSPKGNCVA